MTDCQFASTACADQTAITVDAIPSRLGLCLQPFCPGCLYALAWHAIRFDTRALITQRGLPEQGINGSGPHASVISCLDGQDESAFSQRWIVLTDTPNARAAAPLAFPIGRNNDGRLEMFRVELVCRYSNGASSATGNGQLVAKT